VGLLGSLCRWDSAWEADTASRSPEKSESPAGLSQSVHAGEQARSREPLSFACPWIAPTPISRIWSERACRQTPEFKLKFSFPGVR
jgi:hypothetical protein